MSKTIPGDRKKLTASHDLAIFGAPPLFKSALHVNRPIAPDRAAFDALLDGVWERNWFTNDGPLVRELETRLADWLDVPHCVLTSNATAALDLVIKALGIRGEVLLPSYTFISTAHMLHMVGITPVFCDVDADMALDPADCALRIGPKTGAVIATHVWGSPCNIDALQKLCDAHDIPLLFDAAHAFGGCHHGHRLGRFGRAEIFSLHATKAFHTGEGGVVTTCDAELAAQLRLMRNFGFSQTGEVQCTGLNAKMSEVHAAMGLANLDAIDATRATAKRVHQGYQKGLEGIPGLSLRVPAYHEDSNHHYVVALIDADGFGMSRDTLLRLLVAENVLARRYFHPGGHRCLPFADANAELELPRTDALCEEVMVLPAGAGANIVPVQEICDLIRFIHRKCEEITAATNSKF
ncbi:MAG: DegT/DnrJ/EryC1/StrS family aminotransferase [Roseobacter sp.]